MTHNEHVAVVNPSEPCNSRHMTFGGRCLNCGWNHYRNVALYHVQAKMTDGKWRSINIYDNEDAAIKHFSALGGFIVGSLGPSMYRIWSEDRQTPAEWYDK